MNLAEIKELENLKLEEELLSKRYSEIYLADKKRVLDLVTEEYEKFLTSQGFNTTKTKEGFLSVYGSTKITLEVPSHEESYVGALSVLVLRTSDKNKPVWKIPICTKNGDSIPYGHIQEDEITKTKNSVDRLKSTIENFSPIEYDIFYYKEGDDKRNMPSASSITDVINSIFK